MAVTTLFCLGLRLYVMGAKPPEFSPADNPAADSASLLTRTLTFLYLPSVNFWLLLCPSVLSFDWSMDAVPLITSVLDARNVQTVVFYALFLLSLRQVARNYLSAAPAAPSGHPVNHSPQKCDEDASPPPNGALRASSNDNDLPENKQSEESTIPVDFHQTSHWVSEACGCNKRAKNSCDTIVQ